jgi:hypothetical protein
MYFFSFAYQFPLFPCFPFFPVAFNLHMSHTGCVYCVYFVSLARLFVLWWTGMGMFFSCGVRWVGALCGRCQCAPPWVATPPACCGTQCCTGWMIQLPTVHTKHYGHALHAARYFLGHIESGRATYISCNGYYNQLTGAPFLSCPFLTVISLHPFLGRGLLPPSM